MLRRKTGIQKENSREKLKFKNKDGHVGKRKLRIENKSDTEMCKAVSVQNYKNNQSIGRTLYNSTYILVV